MKKRMNDFLLMQKIFKNDLTECVKRLNKSGSQSSWRTFVRSMFASIEGTCHQFKMTILHHYKEEDFKLDPKKVLFLLEKKAIEKENEIILKDQYSSTKKTIKQTLKLYEELTGEENLVDFSDHGWQDLQTSIEIRNRITHPKKSDDLIIKDEECDILLHGNEWWSTNVAYLSAGYYKKRTGEDFDVKERIKQDQKQRMKELSTKS